MNVQVNQQISSTLEKNRLFLTARYVIEINFLIITARYVLEILHVNSDSDISSRIITG